MTARDLLPTIREVARRLEVSEERAAEIVGEIRVGAWQWTLREPRGLTFQDYLELLELQGKL
jgi:hypothetical protein